MPNLPTWRLITKVKLGIGQNQRCTDYITLLLGRSSWLASSKITLKSVQVAVRKVRERKFLY